MEIIRMYQNNEGTNTRNIARVLNQVSEEISNISTEDYPR